MSDGEVKEEIIEEENIEESGEGSSMSTRIKILGFVAIVVVIECVAAYMMLPDASNVDLMAQNVMESIVTQNPDIDPTTFTPANDQAEVYIGQFTVTSFQSVTNTTIRIDFNLYGMVGKEKVTEFEELVEKNNHRIRDQIIVTVRSADIEMLNNPILREVKQQIKTKVNQILGQPLLSGVIVSEFSMIEQ